MKEEVLVKNIQENINRDEAINELIITYRPLILSIIAKFNQLITDFSIDREDLIQEGNIGLYNAAMAYDFNNKKGAKFVTFAYVVIRRRILTYVKRYNHIYSNESHSIDNLPFSENNRSLVSTRIEDNPDQSFRYAEICERLRNCYAHLESEQQNIIDLKNKGYSYEQISHILGINKKRVDNQLQKIRRDFEIEIGQKRSSIKSRLS